MAAAFILIVFIGPLIELVAAVVVASHIGVLYTVLLIAALSILGMMLLKIEGLAALRAIRSDLRSGRSPGRGLIDGALRMTGVVLLAVPGLITSVVGLLMLFPPVRALLTPVVAVRLAQRAKTVVSRIQMNGGVVNAVSMRFDGTGSDRGQGRNGRPRAQAEFIDVEGWDLDDPVALPPVTDD